MYGEQPLCAGRGQTLGKVKISQMASVLRSPPSAEDRHGNRRRGGGVLRASREVTHRTQAGGNLGTFPTGEVSAELKGSGKQGQKKRAPQGTAERRGEEEDGSMGEVIGMSRLVL